MRECLSAKHALIGFFNGYSTKGYNGTRTVYGYWGRDYVEPIDSDNGGFKMKVHGRLHVYMTNEQMGNISYATTVYIRINGVNKVVESGQTDKTHMSFYDLGDVKPGDRVTVVGVDGDTYFHHKGLVFFLA